MPGRGCTGTYGSHSSFRQRLPKPGLFRRTSVSAVSRSLPGWSMLDNVRGLTQWTHDGDRGTKQPTCNSAMFYWVATTCQACPQGPGCCAGWVFWDGAAPQAHPVIGWHITFGPRKDEPPATLLTFTFSFLTPCCPGCPLGVTSPKRQVISFLMAAQGPCHVGDYPGAGGVGHSGPHHAACDPGAPHPMEANDGLWG